MWVQNLISRLVSLSGLSHLDWVLLSAGWRAAPSCSIETQFQFQSRGTHGRFLQSRELKQGEVFFAVMRPQDFAKYYNS